jgi:DNA uptake protein ComE-like DNA-binding protein
VTPGKQALRAPPVLRPAPAETEREAAATARRVVRDAASDVSRRVTRDAAPTSPWTERLAPRIVQPRPGGGQSLPPSLRAFMEPRLGADLSRVRVHTDARAAARASELDAQAVTEGEDIHFAAGRFAPDSADGRELIAHELAHTLQASAAPQRLGLDDARRWIGERARALPGWTLLALALGADPVTRTPVARSGRAVLRALIEAAPLGNALEGALDRYGVIDRAGAWADGVLARAVRIAQALRAGMTELLMGLGPADLLSPVDSWARAQRLVGAPAREAWALASAAAPGVLTLLREGAFALVAPRLQGTRAWPLLTALLGVDALTGRAVPRSAEALLAGAMALVGQEAVWARIQQARAEGRAGAWFVRSAEGLMGVLRPLPAAFASLWASLSWSDLADPLAAARRAATPFAAVPERIAAWALGSVSGLLELVISVLAPQAWPWLQRAGAALAALVRDPAAFVRALGAAVAAALRALGLRSLELAQRAFDAATGLGREWMALLVVLTQGLGATVARVGSMLGSVLGDLAAASGLDRFVAFVGERCRDVAGMTVALFSAMAEVARGQVEALGTRLLALATFTWRALTTLWAGMIGRSEAAAKAVRALDEARAIDLTGRVRTVMGVTFFRSREGRWERLPPDMSAQEVARREAEAARVLPGIEAAEARAPQPAPKAAAAPPRPAAARVRRFAGARRGGARRAAALQTLATSAAAALQAAVGHRPVARYLAAQGAPALARGVLRSAALSRNEQTHLDAATKRDQSEQAVVIPKSDEQSKGNASQVGEVGARTDPRPDAQRARTQLTRSLERNLPRSLEQADRFARDARGQRMSAEVAPLVRGDKNAVEGTFGDLRHTPEPTPSGHVPQALPAPEAAPPTAPLALAQGLLAPLRKEHLDTSGYTRDADRKLADEGVTQAQLDMVDSGELREAKREKAGLEQAARDEPAAAQRVAQDEAKGLQEGLQADERRERGAMRAQRNAGLGRTARRQQDAKSAHERKREEVAAHINGLYERAQTSVKGKLDALERESMRRFDEGNAVAAQRFERDVKADLDAYKADRYSGFFGKLRKVRDWWKGMDDLPGVKAIFERNRAVFVATVQRLVDTITADSQRVIAQCKQELTEARKRIAEYVAGLDKSLREVGQASAREMGERLSAMDAAVARKETELRQQLQDKQQAAIKAIDEKIEKMKEAMAGALAKLGRLLLWAAKKFFTWALSKFGLSLSDIESIISKGAAVLKAIFTGPIRFVKNLIGAAKEGFGNFREHFVDHLKDALFEWLTGSLGGLRLPAVWNARGLLDVALQVLRISGDQIRRKLLAKLGGDERVLAAVERATPIVMRVFKEGPAAAWEEIQSEAEALKTQMVKQLTDWVLVEVVKKAVSHVLLMFVPGAGIVRAIVGIYDTVMFFIRRAAEIARMVGNFLSSIGEIAAGNIAAAAAALENGLARALKLVIDFLSRLLKLDGIPGKVRGVIDKLAGKVEAVVDRVVEALVRLAQKAGVAVVKGGKAVVRLVTRWWTARKGFKGEDGLAHSLYFAGQERSAVLTVASDPTPFTDFVQRANPATDRGKTAKTRAIAIARLIDAERQKPTKARGTDEDAETQRTKQVNEWLDDLARYTAPLFKDSLMPSFRGDVNPGGVNSQRFGVSMRVVPLTMLKRPDGENPTSEANATFDALNARRDAPGGVSYYIKGHLLNQKLGGPGGWRNLVPLSRKGNARHETQAEAIVKRTVDLGAIVDYEVTPQYAARGAIRGLLARLESSREAQAAKKVKRAIIEAERQVPTSLSVKALIVDRQLKKQNTVLAQTIDNPVSHELADYHLATSLPPEPVNLSEDDADLLQTVHGIGLAIAQRIVRERKKLPGGRWSTYRQLAERVGGISEQTLQGLEDGKHIKLFSRDT